MVAHNVHIIIVVAADDLVEFLHTIQTVPAKDTKHVYSCLHVNAYNF